VIRLLRLAVALGLAVVALGAWVGTDPSRAARAFDPDLVPDPFAAATAPLLWPKATRAFLVDSAGDLENGSWRTRIEAVTGGERVFGPRVIAFEDRWRPVAHWVRRRNGIEFEFEGVALPAPAERRLALTWPSWTRDLFGRSDHEREREAFAAWPERKLDALMLGAPRTIQRLDREAVDLMVSIEVRVVNRSSVTRLASLGVRFDPPGPGSAFASSDASPRETSLFGWTRSGADSAIAWTDLPLRGDRAEEVWRLAPGESRTRRFVISAYPIPSANLARWAQVSHARRARETREYWERETARGTSIDLGDPEIENAIRAARVVLLACRERRGDHVVPIGNPFQYRDVWIRDGARAAVALALHGYGDEARELVSSFDDLQWPNGPFTSQRGQLDATGQALWAYEQVLLRPSADRAVARIADDVWRAWEWYERERWRRVRRGEEFTRMLPASDPNDNELVRARLVGTDAWAIAGYRAAERLLRAAGREQQARVVAAAARAYRRDFEDAIAHVSAADIPPSWEGTGRDWGNLAVVYPCEALPATDPHAIGLATRYWSRAGATGVGFYGDPDTLHGYVAADLGTWALLAGRSADADGVLDQLLHWRDACGGGAELFTRDRGDFGHNLPPHATTAAALLTLLRNDLIYDQGDTLALTLGTRAKWWRHGVVRGAPTRFGDLDLAFERRGDRVEWRWTPVKAWTSLTLPPGTTWAGKLEPPLRRGRGPDVILAPPGISSARVTVREARPLSTASSMR
jgi:hypothetical protein